MTEQAGHLNAPDLVEECARAVHEAMDIADSLAIPEAEKYAEAVLSVLRKRGLLTIQALEMLADK